MTHFPDEICIVVWWVDGSDKDRTFSNRQGYVLLLPVTCGNVVTHIRGAGKDETKCYMINLPCTILRRYLSSLNYHSTTTEPVVLVVLTNSMVQRTHDRFIMHVGSDVFDLSHWALIGIASVEKWKSAPQTQIDPMPRHNLNQDKKFPLWPISLGALFIQKELGVAKQYKFYVLRLLHSLSGRSVIIPNPLITYLSFCSCLVYI